MLTVKGKVLLIIPHCWLGTEVGSVDKVVLCSMVPSLVVALVPDSGLAPYIWF